MYKRQSTAWWGPTVRANPPFCATSPAFTARTRARCWWRGNRCTRIRRSRPASPPFRTVSYTHLPGKIRVRKNGSAGGHNGLKNIIAHLGTDQFPRVRVGVGQKPHPACDMADWVLGKFQGEDKKAVEAAVKRAADAVECLIELSLIHIFIGKDGALCGVDIVTDRGICALDLVGRHGHTDTSPTDEDAALTRPGSHLAGNGLCNGGKMCIRDSIQAVYQPSVQASVPTLVAEERLTAANGVVLQVQALTGLLGPVLGGILMGFLDVYKRQDPLPAPP